MSRGRIIGVASLPVLLLGASNFANEVDQTTAPAPTPPPAARQDADWTARWKAAAAQVAARQVAADATSAAKGKPAAADPDWAQRWKAAADELKLRKAARTAPVAKFIPAVQTPVFEK